MVPGSFGTFAGLKTDASARVLDADSAPIPGLYAVGTDMASVMGGHYPAGGINLGPAMTFGYIAGRHAAGAAVGASEPRLPARRSTAVTAFSLAHLTVLGLPPPEMIRVAARTGYRTVGLRLIAGHRDQPGYPLMDDPAMLRATRRAMAETGVGVLDIEFVKITPGARRRGPGAVPGGRRRTRRPARDHGTL